MSDHDPTCASLFSGIGGLDLGLSRAGFRHVFFCESDAYRRDVLRARWPGVSVYDDVRDVRRGDMPDSVRVDSLSDSRRVGDASVADGRPDGSAGFQRAERFDLLCGGFPCQDLSVAGQRRGLMHEGGRSNLFFEFARIAESLRPRWLLVENVPGLLSSNGGRDFGTVLGTLADVGYGVAWRVLDSRFFGVPQRRRRVFIVGAVADGDPRAAAERAGEILAVGSRCARHPSTSAGPRSDSSIASLSGLGDGGPDDNDGQGGRLISAYMPHRTLQEDGSVVEGFAERPVVDALHGPTGNKEPLIASFAQNQRGELREAEIAMQLTAGGGKPGDGYSAVREGASVRRLMPVECERLQALPDGWTDLGGTADSKRYAALGDAVTASVAEWIGTRIISG